MSKFGITSRDVWVSISLASFLLISCYNHVVTGQFLRGNNNNNNNNNNGRVHKTLASIFRNHRDFQNMESLQKNLQQKPPEWMIPPGLLQGGPEQLLNFQNFNPNFFNGGLPQQTMLANEFLRQQQQMTNQRQPKGPNDKNGIKNQNNSNNNRNNNNNNSKSRKTNQNKNRNNNKSKNNNNKSNNNNNSNNNAQGGFPPATNPQTQNFQNFVDANVVFAEANPVRLNLNGANGPPVVNPRFPRGPVPQIQQGFLVGPMQSDNQHPFPNGLPPKQPFPNSMNSQNQGFSTRPPQNQPNFPNGPLGGLPMSHLEPFLRDAMKQPGGQPTFPMPPNQFPGQPNMLLSLSNDFSQGPRVNNQGLQGPRGNSNPGSLQGPRGNSNQGSLQGPQENQGPPQRTRGPRQGPQGNQGFHQGLQGNQGPPQGFSGNLGFQGNQIPPLGFQGPPQGFQGNQGPLQGFQGNQGPRQGFQGNQVPLQGFQGNQLPLPGFQGPPQGFQGPPQGFQENQGFQGGDQGFNGNQGPQDPNSLSFNFRNQEEAFHQQQQHNFTPRPRKNPGNQQRGPPPPLGPNPLNAGQETAIHPQQVHQGPPPFMDIPNDLPPLMNTHNRPFPIPPLPMQQHVPLLQNHVPRFSRDFPTAPIFDRGPWIPLTSRPPLDWRPADGRWISGGPSQDIASSSSTSNGTKSAQEPNTSDTAVENPEPENPQEPENPPENPLDKQSVRDELAFAMELSQNNFGFRANDDNANPDENLAGSEDSTDLAAGSIRMPVHTETSTIANGAENMVTPDFNNFAQSPPSATSGGLRMDTDSMLGDLTALEGTMQKTDESGTGDVSPSHSPAHELESLLNELSNSKQDGAQSGPWYRKQITVGNRYPVSHLTFANPETEYQEPGTGQSSPDITSQGVPVPSSNEPLPFEKHFRSSLTPNLKDLSIDQLLTHFQTKFDESVLPNDIRKDLQEALDPFTKSAAGQAQPEQPEQENSRRDSNFAESHQEAVSHQLAETESTPEALFVSPGPTVVVEMPSSQVKPSDWSQRHQTGSEDIEGLSSNGIQPEPTQFVPKLGEVQGSEQERYDPKIQPMKIGSDTDSNGEESSTAKPETTFVEQLHSPLNNSSESTDSPNVVRLGNSRSRPDLFSVSSSHPNRRKLVLRRRKVSKKTSAPPIVKDYTTSAID